MAFAWVSEGEKFDCAKCTARDKVVRGCNGERRWKIGDGFVWGCPNKLITDEVQECIEAWARWKRFGWPYIGGWAEQPARYFDIIEAVEREAIAIQSRNLEKAKSGNSNR